MNTDKIDVIVLGAGIVGVSAAIHLQDRGQKVLLVDRQNAGEEASFGNAGLIQCASVVPYGFPRSLKDLLKYGMNNTTSLHYDLPSLPSYLPFLARYWWESEPKRLESAGRDMLPLVSSSVREHQHLMSRAGLNHLARPLGWLEVYRTPALFEQATQIAKALSKSHSLQLEILDAAQAKTFSSAIRSGCVGAVHWLDPITVSSPGDVTKGYATLFEKEGGSFVHGDANTLSQTENGWTLQTNNGWVQAKKVVLALGVWSDTVYKKLGYNIPLMPKRGYHMHYALKPELTVKTPLIDIEEGYALAPMKDGLRLSTGVELATKNRPLNTIQLDLAERSARQILDFGERVQEKPWSGMRPCTPDMRPVIGRAPRHDGLWFAFGHNHLGFTMGPGTGRLIAELITDEKPFINHLPYRSERFD